MYIFCEHFLTPEKTFPVTQFGSRERRKLHFRESNFTNVTVHRKTYLNFPGRHTPGPSLGVGASGTQHLHICKLNHCLRYFQMLPKTLPS